MEKRKFGIIIFVLIILLTSCKDSDKDIGNEQYNSLNSTESAIDLQNEAEIMVNKIEGLDLILSDEHTFHIPHKQTVSFERKYDETSYELNIAVSALYYEGKDDEVLYGKDNDLFAIFFDYSIFELDNSKDFKENVKRISIEKMNLSSEDLNHATLKDGISNSGYSYFYFSIGDYPEHKYFYIFIKFNESKVFAIRYKHPNDNLDIETIINSVHITEKKGLWKEYNELVTENIGQVVKIPDNIINCYRLKIKIPYLYDKGRFNQYIFGDEVDNYNFDFYIVKNKETNNPNIYNVDEIKNCKSPNGLNYQLYKEEDLETTKKHLFLKLNELDTLYIYYSLPSAQSELFDENIIIDSIQINKDDYTWKAIEDNIIQFTGTDENQFTEYIRTIIPEQFEKVTTSESILYKNSSNSDYIEFVVYKTHPDKSIYTNVNEILKLDVSDNKLYKGTTKEKYKYIRFSNALEDYSYNTAFVQLYPGVIIEIKMESSVENIESYLNLINKLDYTITYK